VRINHNLSAMNTHRQLTDNQWMAHKSIEKLSSGLRINRAGDDAAGLAISEKMRGQIRGLDQAARNSQDSISLIQTAEAALSTTHSILQRMRELAVQSSNDSFTNDDRGKLQLEIDQLKTEIDRIAYTTEFNSKKLLNGSFQGASQLQGTKAVSSQLRIADFTASAGSLTAGNALVERGTVQGITGQGYSETGFNALADRTSIITGVNDTFSFTVNGVTHNSGQIAASAGSGYTRSEFANAVEAAINSVLVASGVFLESHQISVDVDSENRLKLTTMEASPWTSLTIGSGTTGASALSAMGFRGYQDGIEGAISLTNGITFTNASSGSFVVSLNSGATGNGLATLSFASGYTYTKEEFISSMQSQLDTQLGLNIVRVSDVNGDGKLELKSAVGTSHFFVSGASSGASNIFGSAISSGGIIKSGQSYIQSGTNTILGYDNGIRIASGVNDQFSISVNGDDFVTITLTDKLHSNKADLVNEINSHIGSSTALNGKVNARLNAVGELEFTSLLKGNESSVRIAQPLFKERSALGALGFGSKAGSINGNVNIASGLSLSGTLHDQNEYKMLVTLGNESVVIDLLDQPDIVFSGANGGLTTRDAIVKGLQAELDKAFGINTLNVATVVSGSEETLRISAITSVSQFSISSVAGYSGASILFNNSLSSGQGLSGQLSSSPTNTSVAGKDPIHKLLATDTLLTSLGDQDENAFGLESGNILTFQGSQNGASFSTSFQVKSDSTIGDLMAVMRSVKAFEGATIGLDLLNGNIRIAGKAGSSYDISNLKLSAQKSETDSTAIGEFNRPMGDFSVIQQAQDASSDNSLTLQVGANQGISDSLSIGNMNTFSLKLRNINISSQKDASSSLSIIDNAMDRVSDERAKLGAVQNRLENTIYNLSVFSENLTASESRIRDIDMARETMAYTKNTILSQASRAMLVQANLQSRNVLFLLQ
jgi:flagellin